MEGEYQRKIGQGYKDNIIPSKGVEIWGFIGGRALPGSSFFSAKECQREFGKNLEARPRASRQAV